MCKLLRDGFEHLESLDSLSVICWRMTLTLCLVLYSVDIRELRKARQLDDNLSVPQYQSQNASWGNGDCGMLLSSVSVTFSTFLLSS